MTDYKHTSGFKMQATILMNLLQVVSSEQNFISSAINDQNGQPHSMGSNKEFVSMLLKTLLCQMFPNLNEVQVESYIIKMFNTTYEWEEFKKTIRDLLISMKSFSSQNNELYEEERKEALQKAQE
jgi:exportin-1